MRQYNFYATEMSPNGTRTLIVSDRDGQIVDSIDEALFGGNFRAKDQLGGVSALLDGESVVYFDYSDEAVEWDEESQTEIVLDRTVPEILLDGEGYCGAELVYQIDPETALKYVAVSPVSDGSQIETFINKYNK